MPEVPQKQYPIDKQKEKNKWRRDTASKCLVAAFSADYAWELLSTPDTITNAILTAVDALDRALSEGEHDA